MINSTKFYETTVRHKKRKKLEEQKPSRSDLIAHSNNQWTSKTPRRNWQTGCHSQVAIILGVFQSSWHGHPNWSPRPGISEILYGSDSRRSYSPSGIEMTLLDPTEIHPRSISSMRSHSRGILSSRSSNNILSRIFSSRPTQLSRILEPLIHVHRQDFPLSNVPFEPKGLALDSWAHGTVRYMIVR